MKKIGRALALTVVFVLVFFCFSAHAEPVVILETQYNYDVSDPAWLKSLTVKEDMLTVSGLSSQVKLKALCEYPYSRTPDSFREDVDYYRQLYTLDSRSRRAAYVFVLDYLNKFSAAVTSDVTDEYVRAWLENRGIIYPADADLNPESRIFARTLYNLMRAGTLGVSIPAGTYLDEAIIMYLTAVLGEDAALLPSYNGGKRLILLDDYVLAAARLALHQAGYNVTSDTEPQEVYRLSALMTVRQIGFSVGDDASSEEIQAVYLAACLGTQYDVTLSPSDVSAALDDSTLPMLILRAMGREDGISIPSGSSYSEAFSVIAENTSRFDLEDGEFYADIYRYEADLEYLRDSIWVSPVTYRTAQSGEVLSLTVNGEVCSSGDFVKVPLVKALPQQTVNIAVVYKDAQTSSTKLYTIIVKQGLTEPPPPSEPAPSQPGESAVTLLRTKTSEELIAALDLEKGEEISVALILPGVAQSGTAITSYISAIEGSSFITAVSSLASGAAVAASVLDAGGTAFVGHQISGVQPPPEGYEYIVNDSGIIVGIKRISAEGENAASAPVSAENPTYEMPPVTEDPRLAEKQLLGYAPLFLVPCGIAVAALIFVFLLRKKDTSGKQSGNFDS